MSIHLSRTEKLRNYNQAGASKRFAGQVKNVWGGERGSRNIKEVYDLQLELNQFTLSMYWQQYYRALKQLLRQIYT